MQTSPALAYSPCLLVAGFAYRKETDQISTTAESYISLHLATGHRLAAVVPPTHVPGLWASRSPAANASLLDDQARRAPFSPHATKVLPPPQLSPQQQPRGAQVHQILSIQSPATVQSGSLWRNPCIGDTLAGNYRVGPDYNVGYSPQETHAGEQQQSQSQHAYDTHHHHRGNPLQHSGASSLHEQTPPHTHHTMSQHHGTAPHQHQILMDPSHLGGLPGTRHMGHPGPSHYGAPGPSHGVPLYPSMTQPHSAGSKRSRPDDLDLTVSGLADLDQSDLDSMQQTPMGSAYTHAPPPPGAPPTHHHHRLPDQGPPTKMMRRDGGDGGLSSGGGGAPSVVGQVGMPAPAPRPRGPKLKFTPEDDQLLIDLKENKNLTWKQIADFFLEDPPGHCKSDQKLRTALADYESEKWRIIANKVGTGFTPVACRERVDQLMGGGGGGGSLEEGEGEDL
ncbi:hypothetical protein PG994_003971 [Apiospora phragmitis]|uniref:Myb-like domain-containing protein n=1 Tax=Apiospora phragmitis TaxID=2905665 RepID=A0ABR1W3F4_9PEZI